MGIEKLFETVDARYGRMMSFANDIGAVSQSLQTYGEWAENELGFMKALIPQGATVVDVGAYIGTHTLAFAHFVGPEGKVISIEPQDESFALLKRNVAANCLTNVQLEHAAAADHTGTLYTARLHITEKQSFGSVALPRSHGPRVGVSAGQKQQRDDLVSVKVITIDSLRLGSCALMKIDVEGFEDLVISGAQQTIKRLSPIIYAECNSVANGVKTFEIMRGFGYEVRMHVVDAFNQDNFLGVEKNIFGSARETALVGASSVRLTCVDKIKLKPYELILKIECADDLVLGMLSKPQYTGEVLQVSAAARSGGEEWVRENKSVRSERDEARRLAHQALEEAQQARQEAAASRGETEMATCERDEARQLAHQALEEAQQARQEAATSRGETEMATRGRDEARQLAQQAQHEAAASRAQMEAAMLQARLAREAADQAETNLVRASAEVAQLGQTLSAMQASRSWRITKPLRIVRSIFRRRGE
jgi:FkbM family methyltransferase